MKKNLIILFSALVIFAGCFIPIPDEEPFDPPAATLLTENVWTDGYLGTADDGQWFKFKASANRHFIHIDFGTLNDKLGVQFYDGEGERVGFGGEISEFPSSNKHVSYSSFTAGKEYYVKLQTSYYSNKSGSYKIALNKSETPPVTIKLPSAAELTVDTLTDGNISDNVKEQWFKFKATAETQYIHVIFGGLTDVEVQLYKVKNGNFGDLLEGPTRLNNNINGNKYIKPTLTVGTEYYIKISPYNFSGKGTYQIGFNELFVPPPSSNIKTLTAGKWADDSFTDNSKGHWFLFTATNASQYIHVDFTDNSSSFAFQGLDILLYDKNGNMVGSSKNLTKNNKNTPLSSITSGQVYYLSVETHTSSYGGTYKIGFTANTTPPTS